jgi:hypothetical protein
MAVVDIPSVGVPVSRPIANVTDPGMVNIEDQAYPPPPPGSQGDVIPRFVDAGIQAFTPPLSMGVPDPTETNVDVSTQNFVRDPVPWIVTPVGNFRIGSDPTLRTRFTIKANDPAKNFVAVTSFTNGGTTYYSITLADGSNLFSLGVDLRGALVQFPNSAPPLDPQNVPTAPIISYGANVLIVDGTRLANDPPTQLDAIFVPNAREGSEDVIQQQAAPVNVFVSQQVQTSPNSNPNVFV